MALNVIVLTVKCYLIDLIHLPVWAGAGVQRKRAGLLITGSLVRTHSGTSFVINFASLSTASAWPSLCAQKRPKTPSFHFHFICRCIFYVHTPSHLALEGYALIMVILYINLQYTANDR